MDCTLTLFQSFPLFHDIGRWGYYYRFADRNFYDDWWNSSSFDQFARKWNKPVHEFLLRHVVSFLNVLFMIESTY
jgi:sterol O-acyltransferase